MPSKRSNNHKKYGDHTVVTQISNDLYPCDQTSSGSINVHTTTTGETYSYISYDIEDAIISSYTGEHSSGDSIKYYMDYNFTVPNWGYADFINERANFQKGISSIAGEPGHFYFKIFFNFDTSFGLLGSLVQNGSADTGKNSQTILGTTSCYSTNSAVKYLYYSSIGKMHQSDDIPSRIISLYKFGNLLSYISNNSPWFFKSVKSLGTADTISLNEIPGDKNVIEVELNQDAVDMRITTLFDLYKYACFDNVKMKEIIPENLRKFDMDIMVFHTPLKYYNTAVSSKTKNKKFNYQKLGSDMSSLPTFKMYSFLGCEFNLESLGSLMSDIKNDTPGSIGETSIKINYDKAYTHNMNNWYKLLFGSDGFYYNGNSNSTVDYNLISKNYNTNDYFSRSNDDSFQQRLEARSAVLDNLLYYNSTNGQYKELIDASEAICSDLYRTIVPEKALGNLYENILSGGVGTDSNYFKEKMKKLHLGSNYKGNMQYTLSKLWSSLKSATLNQVHI